MRLTSLWRRSRRASSGGATNASPGSPQNAMTSEDDPTRTHDEILKAELGLGMIRSLMGMDADEVQNDAVRSYADGNQRVWNARSGLDSSKGLLGVGNEKKKMPGHVVRIDSPEYHLGGIAAVIVAMILTLGAVAFGLWALLNRTPEEPTVPPVTTASNDTDTRSTLRPYVGPD